MEWSWNGQFHMECRHIHHGLHGTSLYGFYGIIHIDDYHSNSYSVLTIFKLNKTFTRSVN